MIDTKLVELSASSPLTVVKGSWVIDGTGRLLEDASVVINGNRVQSVSTEQVDPPPGSLVVDGREATVMPGLIDLHIHFMGKITTDEVRAPITPTHDVKFLRAAMEAYQTLASGVTTVRALGHGPAEQTYALREGIEVGLIHGPRILTSGWAISQTRGHGDLRALPYDWVEERRPRAAFADGELECRKLVRRNFGEGADVIKVYTSDNRTGRPDFTLLELEAIVDEAHRRGKKVAAHAKTYEGVRNAILAGIDTIEHGPSEVFPDLLEMMVERGTFLVPTLATVHLLATEGERWGATSATIERAKREYAGRLENVAAAHTIGVKVAMGSDTAARANYGTLSTRELSLLVEAGLDPMEAVIASTLVSAEALGAEKSLGSLEPGKLADILVAEGNVIDDPSRLQDRRNVRHIIQSSDRWDSANPS
ncbi:MAG TPA: amidohydrolase family protein [Acidimicrobiia bacterium]